MYLSRCFRRSRLHFLISMGLAAVLMVPLLAGCSGKEEKPDPNYYEGPMKSKNPDKRDGGGQSGGVN